MTKKILIFLIIVIAIPVFVFFFRVGYMVVNECEDVPCYPYLDEAKKLAQKEFDQLCKKENLDCSNVKLRITGGDSGCWLLSYMAGEHESHKQISYDVCPENKVTLLDPEDVNEWPRKQQPKVDK